MGDSHDAILKAWTAKRPLLHHLTGDSCWLISFPRASGDRQWYHLQMDSWIIGKFYGDYFGLIAVFNQTRSANLNGYEDVNAICKMIEETTADAEGRALVERERYLDAILISLFLGDHLSPETLLTYPTDTPIMAAPNCVRPLQQMKRFDTVVPLDTLPASEQVSRAEDFLPRWLHIQYVVSPKSYLEVAIVLTIDHESETRSNSTDDKIKSDTLIYILHKIDTQLLDHILEDQTTHILGIFHSHLSSGVPWETFAIGNECLQVVRRLKPEWWMPNHGDPYILNGLYKYLLSVVILPLKEALRLEAGPEGKERDLEGIKYEDVQPGAAFALV